MLFSKRRWQTNVRGFSQRLAGQQQEAVEDEAVSDREITTQRRRKNYNFSVHDTNVLKKPMIHQ